MRNSCKFLVACCFSVLLSVGCGGGSASISTPSEPQPIQACTGASISGSLRDSLTEQVVTRATVAIESGVQASALSPIYNFSTTQSAAADTSGAFRVCASNLSAPAIVVVSALDADGNAYPPMIASVSGTTDLGIVHMGACSGLCWMTQQQSSAAAEISGAITSSPASASGTVVAQLPMTALDGSQSIWNVAMPGLSTAQGITFKTASGACAGGEPFCAAYSFSLPSQNPIVRANGAYTQRVGSPVYIIYATLDGKSACSTTWGFSAKTQDGTAALTASPGAKIAAQSIDFADCR